MFESVTRRQDPKSHIRPKALKNKIYHATSNSLDSTAETKEFFNDV